jgi:hypothetical protein
MSCAYLKNSTAIGTVGSIVSQIEIGVFIIFGCLSTFHPLLAKYFLTGNKEYSDNNSFSIESPDIIESEAYQKKSSFRQTAEANHGEKIS